MQLDQCINSASIPLPELFPYPLTSVSCPPQPPPPPGVYIEQVRQLGAKFQAETSHVSTATYKWRQKEKDPLFSWLEGEGLGVTSPAKGGRDGGG